MRVSIIAKELAKRGTFEVAMIVGDYGQPDIECRDGVRLISWTGVSPAVDVNNEASSPQTTLEGVAPGRRKSLTQSVKVWFHKQNFSRKTKAIISSFAQETAMIAYHFLIVYLQALRSVIKTPLSALRQFWAVIKHTRYLADNIFDTLDNEGLHIVWRKDIQMLDAAQADIYVVPGNHHIAAATAFYCKMYQKKYVFLAGSDYDYYPEYKTDPGGHDIYGESYFQKAYAIEHADLHIVQTDRQLSMLNEGYRRQGIIIPNPISLDQSYTRSASPETILWVGKSDERIKRPSLIFELARRLPDRPFVVILNKADSATHFHNVKEAELLSNVTLIERVPFEEVEKYYAAALLFVNTSTFEGFPNTFLQAAKYGVPIVATDIDPGRMLSQHGCGITCGGDFECFVESVTHMLKDPDLYDRASNAVFDYARTYHDKELVISQYEREFRALLTFSEEVK